MKAPVYNLKNEAVGDIEVADKIFARPWNADLVHQAVLTQVGNRRQPLAHAKDRSEVRGGGRKPWRQKGTGRARHGSIRSPLWKGGGKAHGPRASRVFARKINKKMIRAALHAALSAKLRDGELKFIDSLKPEVPKTKAFFKQIKGWRSALVIPGPEHRLVFRVSRNIPKIKALDPQALNVEDILKFKNVLIERDAVSHIQ